MTNLEYCISVGANSEDMQEMYKVAHEMRTTTALLLCEWLAEEYLARCYKPAFLPNDIITASGPNMPDTCTYVVLGFNDDKTRYLLCRIQQWSPGIKFETGRDFSTACCRTADGIYHLVGRVTNERAGNEGFSISGVKTIIRPAGEDTAVMRNAILNLMKNDFGVDERCISLISGEPTIEIIRKAVRCCPSPVPVAQVFDTIYNIYMNMIHGSDKPHMFGYDIADAFRTCCSKYQKAASVFGMAVQARPDGNGYCLLATTQCCRMIFARLHYLATGEIIRWKTN